MAEYRCYFYDREDHILRIEVIEADEDHEAIARVDALYRARPQYAHVDIFNGNRLVARRQASES
jgi:hypothetical protein